jgi:hypothetical protein
MYAEVLHSEFDAIRKDLIAAYEAKGMRASGRFAEALEVLAGESSATLLGLPYTQQLETGRRPGPVSREGQESIKQWILDKGVFNQAIGEIGLSSLAYLIARKIAREGWNRSQYGGVELVSEVITPERIQSIIDKVGVVALASYTSDITNYLKAG